MVVFLFLSLRNTDGTVFQGANSPSLNSASLASPKIAIRYSSLRPKRTTRSPRKSAMTKLAMKRMSASRKLRQSRSRRWPMPNLVRILATLGKIRLTKSEMLISRWQSRSAMLLQGMRNPLASRLPSPSLARTRHQTDWRRADHRPVASKAKAKGLPGPCGHNDAQFNFAHDFQIGQSRFRPSYRGVLL